MKWPCHAQSAVKREMKGILLGLEPTLGNFVLAVPQWVHMYYSSPLNYCFGIMEEEEK